MRCNDGPNCQAVLQHCNAVILYVMSMYHTQHYCSILRVYMIQSTFCQRLNKLYSSASTYFMRGLPCTYIHTDMYTLATMRQIKHHDVCMHPCIKPCILYRYVLTDASMHVCKYRTSVVGCMCVMSACGICMHEFMYAYLYMCICVCMHVQVCKCMYECMCICMCVCPK